MAMFVTESVSKNTECNIQEMWGVGVGGLVGGDLSPTRSQLSFYTLIFKGGGDNLQVSGLSSN